MSHGVAEAAQVLNSQGGVAGSFQPAVDRIPADVLDAGNTRLVQAFDAESGDLIKSGAAMLKSIVRSPDVGAERVLACSAPISTALSPTGLIETKTDDVY